MTLGIRALLHRIKESISKRLFNETSDKNTFGQKKTSDDNNINPNNAGPHADQNNIFNIKDSINKLNESGDFYGKQFKQNDGYEESWVITKPNLINGEEIVVQISVTLRFSKNLLIFIMPMYDSGSKGLTGEKIESFYNFIHQFNSRVNGGFFTKYTYDGTYAPVFMHHLPLSKMDDDWFKTTLDYFYNIHFGYRKLFDELITTFRLKWDNDAGSKDPVSGYMQIYKPKAIESFIKRE